MSEFRPDFWLTETKLDQPKKTIADYVESHGFLVPKRFNSLNEALFYVNCGGDVMVRSEHPDEYAGASGLFESYNLKQATPNHRTATEELLMSRSVQAGTKTEYLRDLARNDFQISYYTDLTGQDLEQFVEKLSFSYWETIHGANVTVIADDTIPERYHVLSLDYTRRSRPRYQGLVVNSGGEALRSTAYSDMPQATIRQIIEQYEAIRNLPNFNPDNCPLMEMELDNQGRLWFLQYHQARAFSPQSQRLDISEFDPAQGWRRADFVRGQIETSGLHTSLWYPDMNGMYGVPGGLVESLPATEDAAISVHAVKALSEILSRRRKGFIHMRGFEAIYSDMSAYHFDRSKWFKPQTALTLPKDEGPDLIPKNISDQAMDSMVHDDRMARVVLDLASDGESGFIRLNPDSDQPIYTKY